MAKLVEIVGVAHNPNYPRKFIDPGEDPAMPKIKAGYEALKQKMTDARPDVLLVIGNDHLNQIFMDNMPAFLIGKAPRTQGPPRWEADMGIPHVEATIHQEFAKHMVREGFEQGVDFSFSDELNIDHALTIPYYYCSPSLDVPMVPLLTNVMAAPMPPAKRVYQVGEAIRRIIEAWPENMRVGVMASGHLAVEIGGPKGRGASPDIDFDKEAVDIIGKGDVGRLMQHASVERMREAGNFTPGFLNFVMLVGISGGLPANHAELIVCQGSNPAPFFNWEFDR